MGDEPSKYVQEANCQEHIKTNLDKFSLPKRAENPFTMGYGQELDPSRPLDPEETSYYQYIIGIMRWMTKRGQIDISTELSLLSSHLAYPREGHLKAALHIMAYLRQKHNSRLIFDPTYPDIDTSHFPEHEWKDFYEDVNEDEAIPTNMPKPLGKEVDVRAMVHSDHVGDKETRRSRTGLMFFVNMALIGWLSKTKKQPTIKTSVFGAEFVALKNVMESLRALRYKLHMMGVPISGPSYIYGDNMSVIHNTQ
ncbi:hypothetical protein ACHAXR_006979 [Thalassiosira sp. AJA248-18]